MIRAAVTCDCYDGGKLGLACSCKTALPTESVSISCAVPLSVRVTATSLDAGSAVPFGVLAVTQLPSQLESDPRV